MSVIELRDVQKLYGEGSARVAALRGVDLTVEEGEFLAILGRSGSGKSTLLHLLAGLDRPTTGTMRVLGHDLANAGPKELATYRREAIGIVFQSFQLLPGRSARDQVELPLALDGLPRAERAKLAAAALTEVGLGGRLDHTPAQLSGGEQQRVAVARALVRRPPVLLCDEPTGNLDSANADAVVELLVRLQRERRCTVVMITHEPDLAERAASRSVRIEDGRIVEGRVVA
ncbi:MAG: ABC transporter ATP-binding protein [Planctomycetes bacterium]|nr:ABC transporter ATP-binding protein [Planctomycetota bacterium]